MILAPELDNRLQYKIKRPKHKNYENMIILIAVIAATFAYKDSDRGK